MHDWRNILIPPSTTMQQAIEVIDREALRIALVVDEGGRLIGTLSDGDVRRALLRHLPMTTPVAEVMQTRPLTVPEKLSKHAIRDLMERRGVLQLPVVTPEGKVVGLETLQGLYERPRYDNPVFLMAGGFGTRLKPLTNSCPKPLLRVGNTPILELILNSFIDAGFHRFFISTHYMPETIRNHFGDGSQWEVNIEYIHEETPLGTAGALGLLPQERIDSPLLMMNGDLLTTVNYNDLLDFHNTQGGLATMCVREYEQQIPYGVIEANGNKISKISEKPTYSFFVNAGIYVLEPELIRQVPKHQPLDMPDLLSGQLDDRTGVNMFPIHEYWLDIGRMEDFQRAQYDVDKILYDC